MRVPDEIRKCVVFLACRGSEESCGTGFLVMIPSSVPDNGYFYLVTAKHVAERLIKGDWLARINKQGGGGFEDYRSTKDAKWWFHPTESDSVDVAVMPCTRPDDSEAKAVAESMFIPDRPEQAGVGAGDEVFIVGLFNKMRGVSKNLPIVRIGNLALVPDPGELVPGVKMNGHAADADAYLIEARSVGGLSGSPVFVRETIEVKDVPVVRTGGASPKMNCYWAGAFYFLGMAQGHWEVNVDDKNDPYPRTAEQWEDKSVNVGIAVIIPAKKIREVINHPELVEKRQHADRAKIEAQGTTTAD